MKRNNNTFNLKISKETNRGWYKKEIINKLKNKDNNKNFCIQTKKIALMKVKSVIQKKLHIIRKKSSSLMILKVKKSMHQSKAKKAFQVKNTIFRIF